MRGYAVPIIARCVLASGGDARLVCGGFCPEDRTDSGLVPLKWSDGFLASFLLDYRRVAPECVWFGLGRLRSACFEVTEGDPWLLDRDALAVAFEYASLCSGAIRPAEVRVVPDLLPPGRWQPIDPLAVVPIMVTGVDTGVPLRTGRNDFVSTERGDIAEVYVARNRWVRVINRDPETVVSGKW